MEERLVSRPQTLSLAKIWPATMDVLFGTQLTWASTFIISAVVAARNTLTGAQLASRFKSWNTFGFIEVQKKVVKAETRKEQTSVPTLAIKIRIGFGQSAQRIESNECTEQERKAVAAERDDRKKKIYNSSRRSTRTNFVTCTNFLRSSGPITRRKWPRRNKNIKRKVEIYQRIRHD
jgi:hypothetical protein